MTEYFYEKRLLGSDACISIVTDSKQTADCVYEQLLRIAHDYETRFSRFMPESELSQLNEAGSARVSKEFFAAFMQARALYRASGGAFNPLVSIARFGYDEDIDRVRGGEREAHTQGPYRIDFNAIQIDEAARVITLPPGARLDFGAFMKGHIAEVMARAGTDAAGVIVNLGGDIATRDMDAEGKAFVFRVADPFGTTAAIQCTITDAAIATSGTTRRHWTLQGKPFFHILNEHGTDNPATDICSATVVAREGAVADAFATVAIVLGREKAVDFLAKQGLAYCLIGTDGSVRASSEFTYEL